MGWLRRWWRRRALANSYQTYPTSQTMLDMLEIMKTVEAMGMAKTTVSAQKDARRPPPISTSQVAGGQISFSLNVSKSEETSPMPSTKLGVVEMIETRETTVSAQRGARRVLLVVIPLFWAMGRFEFHLPRKFPLVSNHIQRYPDVSSISDISNSVGDIGTMGSFAHFPFRPFPVAKAFIFLQVAPRTCRKQKSEKAFQFQALFFFFAEIAILIWYR